MQYAYRLVLIYCALYSAQNIYTQAMQPCLTVFIHGTINPVFALLNPWNTIQNKAHEQNLYGRVVDAIRDDELYAQDHIALDRGLHQIPSDVPHRFAQRLFAIDQKKIGAHTIVGAYDFVANYATPSGNPATHYYSFGWRGTLDSHDRKIAGFLLYESLHAEIARFEQKPKIRIITHSHGGNVALCTALAEHQQKRGLVIDTLIMYCCPIQHDTAQYLWLPTIKNVINIYTEGDPIQVGDWMTTRHGHSYRRIADVIEHPTMIKTLSPERHVCDVRLLINKNSCAFNHCSPWYLGLESSLSPLLHPLPAMVLTPLFTQMIEPHVDKMAFDLHLNIKPSHFSVSLRQHDSSITLEKRKNIRALAAALKKNSAFSWQPTFVPDNGMIWCAKTHTGLKFLYQDLRLQAHKMLMRLRNYFTKKENA